MSLSPLSVAESVAGGLLIFSGIKGSTIQDTIQAVFSGNIDSATDTEQIGSTSTSTNNSSDSGYTSGTAEENYLTVANYLVANGYTAAAAAGICACIAGESTGNPLSVQNSGDPGSGGVGLIQWTPGSEYPSILAAVQSGDADKAMSVELPAILEYNNSIGSSYIQMLNQQTSPVGAADFYSQYFEKPAVTDSDVDTSVANSVYAQLTAPTAGSTTGNTRATTS